MRSMSSAGCRAHRRARAGLRCPASCWKRMHVAQCRELKVLKHLFQLSLHAPQPAIGPDSRNKARRHARLIRVQLPGMSVDARWLLLHAIDLPNSGRRVAVREQTQVSSAPDRGNALAGQPHGSDRDLNNGARTRVNGVCVPAETRYTIAVVNNGVDAGIVRKPQFGKNLQGPEAL